MKESSLKSTNVQDEEKMHNMTMLGCAKPEKVIHTSLLGFNKSIDDINLFTQHIDSQAWICA